ncbi:uncharacterized protein LOC115620996 [Scaptodrosophila lebanonensis]|uniref:Uncharacterized protein LOC115620996 n=1 Tax=Drosophila lebanonensis TaxID=7225 RepID=A0A6J2T0G1_DROLE|nr:uncharacterized protein LOC115620996 [Scaptodrosophila lebanonensis]
MRIKAVHTDVCILFLLCIACSAYAAADRGPSLGLSADTNPMLWARGNGVPYFRASIPMRIYECLRDFSILRCTKLFVLQKLEERKQFAQTGNLTRDFLDQFFGEETQMGSLITQKYHEMPEKELNQRLVANFQRFFKHRDIKLHFLPGMLVKIVPSKENKLKLTLKKAYKTRTGRARRRDSSELPLNLIGLPPLGGSSGGVGSSASVENYEPEVEGDSKQGLLSGGGGSGGDGGGGGGVGHRHGKRKKKHSYKTTMLQMAVPILVMPAILLGSMLPFVLPALKMATILSLLMNNGAFMAALLYAARTHANAQEEQHISYGYGGTYH